MKRKEKILSAVFIGCIIVPALTVFSKNEFTNESQKEVSISENPLANVTIEMLTNLPSHRADGIPSTLPDSTFSVHFNITNLSTQEIRQLEIFPETNDYGFILNPFNDTKETLTINESWITEDYIIETNSQNGVPSSSLDLAIVLDQSGSMGDEIDALTNKLIDVIDEVSLKVPDLKISLILFGGGKSNPYIYPNLVYPLTYDIESIVDVLSSTTASGSNEPWGDALWVAQNRLNWRENVVKLIVLITDEPCDGGEVIGDGFNEDYDGQSLYNLFEELEEDKFILCTIAASGSNSLTQKQLKSGAEYTSGTYIILGGEGPQTGDIPEIIGELIVTYAVEIDFKITLTLSHLNNLDNIESTKKTFVILLDELPPEIDSWVYLSEDFVTDEKHINIMTEVKDVTGTAFVEIYYKTDTINFWVIANASKVFNYSYILSIPYLQTYKKIYYQIFSKDWLNNEVLTEIYEVDLLALENKELINPGKRKEYVLIPNQSIVCKLVGDDSFPSFGIIFSKYLDSFNVLSADINDSTIILNNENIPFQTVLVKENHVVKVSLIAQDYARIIITNVIPQVLSFKEETTKEIDETDALLFSIDNKFTDEKVRSLIADSQIVQTNIIVFNSSNWEHISTGSSEVILPEEELYILIYAEYHTGEILISFNYEEENNPYDHYWTEASNYWPMYVPLLCLAIIGTIIKRKRR